MRGATAFLLSSFLMAGTAEAACQNTGNFNRWLDGFREEAAAAGISEATIAAALDTVRFDQSVIDKDRRQAVFSQSFLEFSDRMVAKYRLQQGAGLLKKYASTFASIEKTYGVPGPVIVAFWGLETDFGANLGKSPTLTSLATLAYDCRRPERFRGELMAALKIVERGDLRPEEMIGPWAGEMGQTQFLASHYFNYGVDYDGDGRVDLLKSVPDVLASSANLLKAEGWRAGEPWLREVRVPEDMPWDQADLAIKHPESQWAKWGVTLANGKPLKGKLQASLLLPMGRNGPAFLAYHNFDIYTEWNQSLVYATTAAYFATRLAGAPPVGRGRGAEPFGQKQVVELQKRLAAQGYDVGKIDGFLGAKTRAAVKDVQQKLGLPADSYPDSALMARLR